MLRSGGDEPAGEEREVGDYRRAYEWTEAIRRRGVAVGSIGFPGDCRTHRAAVHLAHGDWGLGAEEAELACVETISFDRGHTALALTGLGEIRLRQGALDDAEAAFHRALELGMDPQPGRARLALARGDLDAALGAIRTAVADAGEDAGRRVALLPAQAEIEIAADDIAAARSTADRLLATVGASRSAALRASVAMVDGLVLLADGDAVGAAGPLRQAVRGWLEIGAPFEAGRSRFALAQALQARGDAGSARLEARAARDTFDRLGATPDREACDRFLAGVAPAAESSRATVRVAGRGPCSGSCSAATGLPSKGRPRDRHRFAGSGPHSSGQSSP